ncbi:MAG: hypothetical protein IPK66_18940 [Rhodospirillales bacterium]|nr:hypothetical protein [Rhodospirillales bacterium]MBK8177252.1 hypothetical protein [Rhodospirillales bacterium]
MGDGKESAVPLRAGVAGGHPTTATRDGRFLASVSRNAPAALTGLAVVLVGADAFAAGGNAIAQMLNSVVDNATMCGGAIAALAACGAGGGMATGNHGIVGPCLKGAGGGTLIASSAQLVGLVLPGGGAGGSLGVPAAISAMDWLHILAGIVS